MQNWQCWSCTTNFSPNFVMRTSPNILKLIPTVFTWVSQKLLSKVVLKLRWNVFGNVCDRMTVLMDNMKLIFFLSEKLFFHTLATWWKAIRAFQRRIEVQRKCGALVKDILLFRWQDKESETELQGNHQKTVRGTKPAQFVKEKSFHQISSCFHQQRIQSSGEYQS